MTRTRSNTGKLSAGSRKILNRTRREMAKEIAAEAAARQDKIRNEINNYEANKARASQVRTSNGVTNGAASVLRTVSSSWEMNLPINIQSSQYDTNWGGVTDFTSITIYVPPTAFTLKEDGSFDQSQLRKGMLKLLALGYHEIGHNLFTIPFSHMPWSAAGMESSQNLQMIWNCMEDQRMESAVVSESPVIAGYFAAALPEIILEKDNLHIMVRGRTYLPAEYRDAARALFVHNNGEELAAKVDSIIDRYVAATNVPAMCGLVKEMADVYDELRNNGSHGPTENYIDTHGEPYQWGDPETCMDDDSPEDRAKRVGKAIQKDQKDKEEAGKASGSDEGESEVDGEEGEGEESAASPGDGPASDSSDGESDEEGGEGESDSKGNESDKAGSGYDLSDPDFEQAEANQTEETPPSKEDLDSMVQDIADRAMEDIKSHLDSAGHQFTQTVNDTNSDDFPVAALAGTLSSERQGEAQLLAERMVRAFEQATANRDPSWQRNVDHGVVDSFRYKTRQRGDRNFYRRRSGEQSLGSDIAVTLLLDNSGSMMDQVTDLSVMAYGVKLACHEIGASCRVLLFNSGTFILSDVDDAPEPTRIVATGGTDPDEGLQSLAAPIDDSEHHLALVMTDGSFGMSHGNDFNYGDTHVLGYLYDPEGNEVYDPDPKEAQEAAEYRFKGKNIHNCRYIRNLNAMAEDVESYIVSQLR